LKHHDTEKEGIFMHVSIIITMLFVGIILGFIGAGGSGFIISLLTLLFGVSIVFIRSSQPLPGRQSFCKNRDNSRAVWRGRGLYRVAFFRANPQH
jgi:hypothetical protein